MPAHRSAHFPAVRRCGARTGSPVVERRRCDEVPVRSRSGRCATASSPPSLRSYPLSRVPHFRGTIPPSVRPQTRAAMGFYLHASLRAGPFRFTMSRAGMGVSAGVPGFRVGAGPRGHYVHMGGGAVHYRSMNGAPVRADHPYVPPGPTSSPVVTHDVTGASIQQLVSVAPSELLSQLQAAARRIAIWPFATVLLLIASGFLGKWAWLLLGIGAFGVIWLALRDRATRSVVVMYDVNDEAARRFDDIVEAIGGLQRLGGFWHVTAAGSVRTTHQYKVNAGASTVLARQAASAHMKGPKNLVTNVAIPTLTAGSRSLHFLPDRVLIREGNRFADLPYQQLCVTAHPITFIEPGTVPRDGRIVDMTWRFVNVKGGPDRRFKNNRQIPVMEYGRLTIFNQYGLHLIWDASQVPPMNWVASALLGAADAQMPVILP
ncbi:MAG: DUF4236 domain-containing protein [Streptosporangiales bacterium]|nr:DUF4236 domain-containing protein [Streptosporangiales bacterium]